MVDRALMEMETGSIDRLMVFMPPRHGKSYLISQHYPAWYLGTHPDNKVIMTSHTHSLASGFSAAARDLLIEYGPEHFGVEVSKDVRSKEEWQIEGHRGGLKAAGVGGPIVGSGADLFIIDDPVKNDEQAISPVYREKVWNWWQSTASTRLEPHGRVALMNTRWHDDDLAGRLLKHEGRVEDGGRWTVLSLPAIAEQNDQMGREPGEPLWPERWPLRVLEQTRKDKTDYWWAAMYQQRPGQFGESSWPAEYFEGLWADQWPTEFKASAMALDPAMGKDKTRGDYQAIVFAGLLNGIVYVDARLIRVPPPELVDVALSWWTSCKPNAFTCEANGFQDLLGGMLNEKTRELGLFDCICMPDVAVGNKEIRIEREITPLLARDKLRLRKGSPHTQLLFDQMRSFPNADHDDGPDALALAIKTLRDRVVGLGEEVVGRIG